MSQPHPPRPEDQPAQQPAQPQEPRTQQIPVITPDAQPAAGPSAQPEPRPAFLSQSEPAPSAPAPAGGPYPTAVLPAVDGSGAPPQVPGPPATPPPPAPAQAAPQQAVPQQAVPAQVVPTPGGPANGAPPGRVWPQPGPTGGSAVPPGAPQPTGPLDLVPGFSTPAPPPVPPPVPAQGSTAVTAPETPGDDDGAPGAGTRARAAGKALGAKLGSGLRSGQGPGRGAGRRLDRAVLAGLGLGVLALVVLELGLTLDPGARSLWSAVPSWSAFATVAAVVALVPLAFSPLPGRFPARSAWRVGAAGGAGLGAFWVLIALPLVASDRGFLLTAALALLAGALWLAPGRNG